MNASPPKPIISLTEGKYVHDVATDPQDEVGSLNMDIQLRGGSIGSWFIVLQHAKNITPKCNKDTNVDWGNGGKKMQRAVWGIGRGGGYEEARIAMNEKK